MIPGEIQTAPGEIELNNGRDVVRLTVANTGDRPIQVGSHYHFYETNGALAFERDRTRGFRLNIPAGTAVRFEPGQTREQRPPHRMPVVACWWSNSTAGYMPLTATTAMVMLRSGWSWTDTRPCGSVLADGRAISWPNGI